VLLASLCGFALFVVVGIVVAVLCIAAGQPQPAKPPDHVTDTTPHGNSNNNQQQGVKTTLPNHKKEVPPLAKNRLFAALIAFKDMKAKVNDTIIPPDDPQPLKVRVIETVYTKEKPPRELKLAVTEKDFDDMGQLLRTLGKGYDYTLLEEIQLESYEKLKQFDVIFLTCKRSTAQNLHLNAALRRFVEEGGTLYASDLRFDALRGAFPEYIEKGQPRYGLKQKTTVRIVDDGLRDVLGEKVELHFDADNWRPARFNREMVTVYMEGNFLGLGNTKKDDRFFEPLLVKFTCGKGTVIFTSFHNAAQQSEVETKLLKYLVFTAVTSHEETRVSTTMISGGFSPQPPRRLAASDDAPSATQVYHNKKPGKLQFALGFTTAGAKLKLELVAPDGKKYAHEGTATFGIEVPDAAAGDWRYTITALTVPYPNFPFTLTVGEAAPGK
jgi:hypothetical protein